MDKRSVDILIVGGGIVGASLLIALRRTGYDVMLVEEKPLTLMVQPGLDARNLALSPSSVQILQQLGVWALLEPYACPIDTIHISERQGFGRAQLQRDGTAPLGYVVEIQHLNQALYQSLDPHAMMAPAHVTALDSAAGEVTIQQSTGTMVVKAQLIVAADGADSSLRQWCGLSTTVRDYQRHAVVANIALTRSHRGIAYERFTPTGPLALLPMNGNCVSLVWSLPPDEANEMAEAPEPVFLQALQRAFGYRLGRFVRAGKRMTFPLRQVVITTLTHERVVFIGNAAHTLHPVAAQGFNLGLRDVAMLAQCIVQAGLGEAALATYQDRRAHDQRRTVQFTDGLVQLYACNWPGMALARRLGLVVFDQVPLLKQALSRFARGYSGVTPDLVCGIPLGVTSDE